MKQIIVVKPGTLKPKDKEKLSKDGNIVIEHPEPHGGLAFKNFEEAPPMTFTNCYTCGERIHMTNERNLALITSKVAFYCSHGHRQVYK